jgi:hypothetical protein
MKPEIIRFLRSEAHKMYMGLTFDQRRLTNEQRIYRGLKQAWRAGSKVSKEARGISKSLHINFKELDQFTRNRMAAGGEVDEVGTISREQYAKVVGLQVGDK